MTVANRSTPTPPGANRVDQRESAVVRAVPTTRAIGARTLPESATPRIPGECRLTLSPPRRHDHRHDTAARSTGPSGPTDVFLPLALDVVAEFALEFVYAEALGLRPAGLRAEMHLAEALNGLDE